MLSRCDPFLNFQLASIVIYCMLFFGLLFKQQLLLHCLSEYTNGTDVKMDVCWMKNIMEDVLSNKQSKVDAVTRIKTFLLYTIKTIRMHFHEGGSI